MFEKMSDLANASSSSAGQLRQSGCLEPSASAQHHAESPNNLGEIDPLENNLHEQNEQLENYEKQQLNIWKPYEHMLQEYKDMSKYMCDFCGRGFTRSSNLKCHIRSHTDERPYKCKKCARPFRRLYTMQEHLRKVHKEPPFRCSACGQGFLYKAWLIRHEEEDIARTQQEWLGHVSNQYEQNLIHTEETKQELQGNLIFDANVYF